MRELHTKPMAPVDDFEDEVRRMLHRRAGDIAPLDGVATTPAMFSGEGLRDHNVAEPTQIHVVDPAEDFQAASPAPGSGRSARWLAAAAAILLIAVIGGLAALSRGGDGVSNVVSADPAHGNNDRVSRPKGEKHSSTTSTSATVSTPTTASPPTTAPATSVKGKPAPKNTKAPQPVTPAPPTTKSQPDAPNPSTDPADPTPEQPEPSSTTQPTQPTVPTTAAPQPDAPGPAGDGEVAFTEDFAADGSLGRFDFQIYHRDDHVVRDTEWIGDHVSTGPNDLCGPPTEKRTVTRGDRGRGFNQDWIYRCVPGGDRGKAHIMTSIGDTSGYSIGGFSPKQEFSNVTEIRWDVNQTDLGDRQWTEVVVVPAAQFSFDNMPCATGLPCGTTTHSEVGSVGTHWTGLGARTIHTPSQPGGYTQAGGDLGYRCDGCPYAPSRRFGEAYGAGDPALTSIAVRRHNFFRDNGDGTLTWGFHLDDGSIQEFTVPGAFPDGPVRVVFKDHNYTPLKSPAKLLPETTFTWHWDNIEVSVG